ncbi:MAG: hypothetical protein ACQES9_03095 [Myxococcota bacterium]
MNKKTPLQIVKEKFGSKEKLIEQVIELISESKEQAKELEYNLTKSTNKKLLRLHKVGNRIKEEFGSKEELVDKIVELKGMVKDKVYRESLMKKSLPKLLDNYNILNKKK